MSIHPHTSHRQLLFLAHGILTGNTWPNWPARGKARAVESRPDLIVLPTQYKAGPFPRFTHFVVNRRKVRRSRRRLDLYPPDIPIHFASHSNGAGIVLSLADQLIADGRLVGTITLIAAAVPSDIRTLRRRYPRVFGQLGPDIEAWSSPSDRVVAPWPWPLRQVRWPWGDLGNRGFQPPDHPDRTIRTRVFPGYRHSTWFSAILRDETLDLIFNRVPRLTEQQRERP